MNHSKLLRTSFPVWSMDGEQSEKAEYSVITLPLDYNKSFLDFTDAEIETYYQWFLNNKGERLASLCKFLFPNAMECLKEENLKVIEVFLQNSISVIQKPYDQYKAELAKIPGHLQPYADPDKYLLDDRTICICFDIGIFLGELMRTLDKKVSWQLETNDEFSNYGQPILAKNGVKVRLNPFRVAKNIAATIHEGRYEEGQLFNVFATWKNVYKVNN